MIWVTAEDVVAIHSRIIQVSIPREIAHLNRSN